MTTEIATVIARFQMNAVIMSIKVGLPLKLLGTWLAIDCCCARVRVLAIRVVSLHM